MDEFTASATVGSLTFAPEGGYSTFFRLPLKWPRLTRVERRIRSLIYDTRDHLAGYSLKVTRLHFERIDVQITDEDVSWLDGGFRPIS